MSKNDQEEALDKVLTANLARAIDFIKFAETKNAAILTFNSAWILALANFVLNSKDLWVGFIYCLPLCIFLLTFSAMLALVSLLPKAKISNFYGSNHRPSNLLFVGDMESISPPDLKDRFISRYLPISPRSYTDQYIEDIAQQLNIVSNIAMSKFRSFNRSAAITLLALLIAAAPAMIHLFYFVSEKISIKVS